MAFEKAYTGDGRYWFHLLPAGEVGEEVVRPPQGLLISNPMIPLEMDLFHTYLCLFLSWIPTRSGNWITHPEENEVIDRTGSTQAGRIFIA